MSESLGSQKMERKSFFLTHFIVEGWAGAAGAIGLHSGAAWALLGLPFQSNDWS